MLFRSSKIRGIGIVRFSPEDVVRHSLVQKIIKEDETPEKLITLIKNSYQVFKTKILSPYKETLSNIQPSCSSHMKTAITALLKKFEYAENALNANIGNGVIGRINFN